VLAMLLSFNQRPPSDRCYHTVTGVTHPPSPYHEAVTTSCYNTINYRPVVLCFGDDMMRKFCESYFLNLATGWGPLISYIHPVFGYELLIPEGAAAGHDADPSPALIDDLVVAFTRDNNACIESKICAKCR
jgi:hypothetical protein